MEVIEHPYLSTQDGIRHALFTRRGGVSEGVFESLNCGYGSGDDPAAVAENRRRASARFGLAAERLCTAYQSHSDRVVVVDRAWKQNRGPNADGLVTRTTGLAIGVLSADCAPVLLAERDAGVVGIAHAGWRGALSGIIEATVRAMIEEGARPERIVAVIGPCIGGTCYEVGPEFRARFAKRDPGSRDLFDPAPGRERFLFDLAGYVARRLENLHLKAVASAGLDTFSDAERFFSYRRASLRGEANYGRALSAIALAP